jgi:hypothetical protein
VVRLLVVETRRFLARRLVRITVGLILLGILIAGVSAFVTSHRPSAEQLAAAESQREELIASCAAGEFGIPPGEIPPGETLEQYCEEIVAPAEELVASAPFRLAGMQDVFLGTGVVAMLVAWLLGASFVGAEWHAGTMGTLLTWDPRRIRVIVAKALVAVVAAFVLTVVAEALLGLAVWPAAAFRGSTEGIDAAWFRETAGVVLRGGGLAAMGAGIGFAVASLARNTAAALGVGFGYLVVFEMILASLRPGWSKWLLVPNIAVFMTGNPAEAGFEWSTVRAGLLLAGYTAALLVVAGGWFRARDVR